MKGMDEAMPLNFGRETPGEYEGRIDRDARILWHLVYSISGREPEFQNDADREFAVHVADDFIDRRDSSLRPRKYIEQFHELAGKGVQ
jgi:hypothetical protein